MTARGDLAIVGRVMFLLNEVADEIVDHIHNVGGHNNFLSGWIKLKGGLEAACSE